MDDVPGWAFSDGRVPLLLVAMVKVCTGNHGDSKIIQRCVTVGKVKGLIQQSTGKVKRRVGRERQGKLQSNK